MDILFELIAVLSYESNFELAVVALTVVILISVCCYRNATENTHDIHLT